MHNTAPLTLNIIQNRPDKNLQLAGSWTVMSCFCFWHTQKEGEKTKQRLCAPTLATALDRHRRNSEDPGQSKHQKQITSAVHGTPAEKTGHRIDGERVKVIFQHRGLTNFKEADCIFQTGYGLPEQKHHVFNADHEKGKVPFFKHFCQYRLLKLLVNLIEPV